MRNLQISNTSARAPRLSGLAAVLLAGFTISACSVRKDYVKNEPPVMQKNLAVSADTDFGVLRPKSITLFFWPDNLTEEQSRAAAFTVRSASLQIDQIYTKEAAYGQLELAFATQQCLQTWATGTTAQPGANVPWASGWKTLDAVAPIAAVPEGDAHYDDYKKYLDYVAQKQSLDQCVSNQTTRQQLFPWIAQQAAQELQAANLAILKTVDPTFPKQVNWLTVSADGSQLSFTQGADGSISVKISFKDFIMPGFSPSTTPPAGQPAMVFGASYVPSRKLLSFAIPEISATTGQPTGRLYKCALERGPDFLGMARFSGEVYLSQGDTTLRTGSISITGPMTH